MSVHRSVTKLHLGLYSVASLLILATYFEMCYAYWAESPNKFVSILSFLLNWPLLKWLWHIIIKFGRYLAPCIYLKILDAVFVIE